MRLVTKEQKAFLDVFILDGEYDLHATCRELGVTPSEAFAWFSDRGFQRTLKRIQAEKLNRMGYTAMRTLEDTLAIAHSDITQVQVDADRGLDALPRHIRVAIKSVDFGVIATPDGKTQVYPKKVTMHDKAWALQRCGDWFRVADQIKNGGVETEEAAQKIGGLLIRPPITKDEATAEEILKD